MLMVLVRHLYAGTTPRQRYLGLIRRYPRGRPDPFGSGRDLGRLPSTAVHVSPENRKVVRPRGSRAGHLPAWLWSSCPAALPHRTGLLPVYSPEGRCQGLIRVYVDQALAPALVARRSDRPLMPYRRRITIRRQSGGGPLQLPRSSRTRWSWSLSPDADGRAVDDRLRRGHLAASTAALSLAVVRRLVRLLEGAAWPDPGFLARPLGGAAVDSRLDQRVYRTLQACGQQDLPPAAL